MKLIKSDNKLNPQPNWGTAIDIGYIPQKEDLANFDQNGYDLTPLKRNMQKLMVHTLKILDGEIVSSKIGL